MTQICCKVCKEWITKYIMDAGAWEFKIKGEYYYICDNCARSIAHQMIEK